MGAMHFVIPIRSDDKQVVATRCRHEQLQQLSRSGIDPLEIVQKEHKRMRWLGKHTDEVLKNQMKAMLGDVWLQDGDLGLWADNEFHFGNDLDNDLAAEPQAVQEFGAPSGYVVLAGGEELSH